MDEAERVEARLEADNARLRRLLDAGSRLAFEADGLRCTVRFRLTPRIGRLAPGPVGEEDGAS